jgi:thiamine biosynthesis lipoprotein
MPPPAETARGGLDRVEHIMGTAIRIDVRDPETPPELLDAAFDWLRAVDDTFSTYRPDSQISRIRRGELSPDAADPDVRSVLDRCAELREDTDGYFDPWALPGGVDPSGFVKGWSVDRAAAVLEDGGARTFSIDAGGDVIVRGCPPGEEGWRVGILHPVVRDRVARVIVVSDVAVATSGAYERGEHVLDPVAGTAARGLLSATVVGPELGTADALATAIFAMGAAGPSWSAWLADDYSVMSITTDQRVLLTRAFPAAGDPLG